MEAVGIDRVDTIGFDRPFEPTAPAGALALDGERELTFGERDRVTVTLRDAAFRTVDVAACMAHAASHGRFVEPAHKLPIIHHQLGG